VLVTQHRQLPNWLFGPRVSHLTPEARALLVPPWPNVVVATGRRTAAASLWIKAQSDGAAKAVQIGRPRMALSDFDVVYTTPQYGLPSLPNIVQSALPLVAAKDVAPEVLQHFETLWRDLPRPLFAAVVGGQKFPLKLGEQELQSFGVHLNQLAKKRSGSILLVDSPRSPNGALQTIAKNIAVPHWVFRRAVEQNPYDAALKLADELIVTSDSVSMVTDMLLMEKPTWVFRLPLSPLSLKWRTERNFALYLASRGVLNPPRNVDGFQHVLSDMGYVGDLKTLHPPALKFDVAQHHANALQRIKHLLQF
jgi:uncharacterized protein